MEESIHIVLRYIIQLVVGSVHTYYVLLLIVPHRRMEDGSEIWHLALTTKKFAAVIIAGIFSPRHLCYVRRNRKAAVTQSLQTPIQSCWCFLLHNCNQKLISGLKEHQIRPKSNTSWFIYIYFPLQLDCCRGLFSGAGLGLLDRDLGNEALHDAFWMEQNLTITLPFLLCYLLLKYLASRLLLGGFHFIVKDVVSAII